MNNPFEVVSDLAALRAIPENYRYEGMEVIVANTYTNGVKQKFTLSSGITNASWVEGNVGGGSSTFIGLTDVPASFVGAALQALRVNAGETGLEFYTPSGGGGVITGNVTYNIPTDYADFAALKTFLQANTHTGIVTVNYESANYGIGTPLPTAFDVSGLDMLNLRITSDGPVSVDTTAFPLLSGAYRALFAGIDGRIGEVSGEFTQTAGPAALSALLVNFEFSAGLFNPLGASKTLTLSNFSAGFLASENVVIHGRRRLTVNGGVGSTFTLEGVVDDLDLSVDAAFVNVTGGANFSRLEYTGASSVLQTLQGPCTIENLVLPPGGVFTLRATSASDVVFKSDFNGAMTPALANTIFYTDATSRIRGSLAGFIFTPTSTLDTFISGSDLGRVELFAASQGIDTSTAIPNAFISSSSFSLGGGVLAFDPTVKFSASLGVNTPEFGGLMSVNVLASDVFVQPNPIDGGTYQLQWFTRVCRLIGAARAAVTFDLSRSEAATVTLGAESAVTAVTITPAGAGTIYGAPAGLAAGEVFTLRRQIGTDDWYRVG